MRRSTPRFVASPRRQQLRTFLVRGGSLILGVGVIVGSASPAATSAGSITTKKPSIVATTSSTVAATSTIAATTTTMKPAPTAADLAACPRKKVLSVTEQQWQGTGVKRVQDRYRVAGKRGFWFASGMTIDADGSPRAFHRVSALGLDDLVNAGQPGNWWGILTYSGETNGRPVVQGRTDPAPGFYISQTGLEDTSKKERDPRRYVDAVKVPYVVLSGTDRQNLGAVFGDYIVVYNSTNHKYTYAMYGDNWPILKIGEGSVALANELGINPDPRNGGVEDMSVVYLVFPKSRSNKWTAEETVATTRIEAGKRFTAWGGIGQLEACLRL
jgi:Fungal chitosanase of glycosyl hydrolase group 75